VKSLRIVLLLLLAVLLPMRSAIAGAMLCPVTGAGTQAELNLAHAATAHHALDDALGGAHDHAAGAHHHAAGAHDHGAHHEHGGPSDKCNVCSAFCSAVPLIGSLPELLPPLDAVAMAYPDDSAPAPSFLSDGQERPPRSS
jgi:hypothetical protein